MSSILPADDPAAAGAPFVLPRARWLRKHPTLVVGALLLLAIALLSIAAPWIAPFDPQDIDPLARLQPWGATCSAGRCGVAGCR